MKKLFEEIKQDKLKFATVCVAFVVFVSSIVVSMVNIGDTYAISTSDFACANSTYEVVTSNGKFYCCPEGWHYNELYQQCFSEGFDGDPEKTCAQYGAVHELNTVEQNYFCRKDFDPVLDHYTITLDGNGGSLYNDLFKEGYEVEIGDSFTFPGAQRSGYTLLGWSTSQTATTPLYKKDVSYVPAASTTFYAVWEAWSDSPTVDTSITKTMYSSDGGYVPCFETTSTGATMSGSYDGCTKIELNPTNFNNWYYNSAKNCYIEQSTVSESSHSSCSTPDTSNPIYMYSSNVSSVPCYTQANKSSGVKSNLYGCATIKVVPINGWYYSVTYSCYIESSYLSSSLSSSCPTGGGSEEPVTTYTVSYNANGGDNAPSSQTKTKGTDLTLSSDVPTRDGFEFVNWNTEKDGTGTSYGKGGKYTADSDVTLYAQWKENTGSEEPVTTYTISYNANGGDNAPSSQTKTKGTDLTLSSDVPTRDGFEFVNWNTEKDGTGTSYGKGGKYIADSDVTLYAQWKENSKVDEGLPSGSPSTGDALIYIAWAIGLGALGYSVYYFIKKKSYL